MQARMSSSCWASQTEAMRITAAVRASSLHTRRLQPSVKPPRSSSRLYERQSGSHRQTSPHRGGLQARTWAGRARPWTVPRSVPPRRGLVRPAAQQVGVDAARRSAADATTRRAATPAATASALNSSLRSRRRRRPTTGRASIVSTRPPRVEVETSTLCPYVGLKKSSPDAYHLKMPGPNVATLAVRHPSSEQSPVPGHVVVSRLNSSGLIRAGRFHRMPDMRPKCATAEEAQSHLLEYAIKAAAWSASG